MVFLIGNAEEGGANRPLRIYSKESRLDIHITSTDGGS